MSDKTDTSHTTEVVLIGGIGLSSHTGLCVPRFVLHVLLFAFFVFAADDFDTMVRSFLALAKDRGTSEQQAKTKTRKKQRSLIMERLDLTDNFSNSIRNDLKQNSRQ